jgi:hypothetical protein
MGMIVIVAVFMIMGMIMPMVVGVAVGNCSVGMIV